jgi:hypothetical protein
MAARSRKAHVIAAPRTAPTITKPARNTGLDPIPDWVRNNASRQLTRSNAADPAAAHSCNAEVPISGSKPSIHPLHWPKGPFSGAVWLSWPKDANPEDSVVSAADATASRALIFGERGSRRLGAE